MFNSFENIMIIGAARSGIGLAEFIDSIGKHAVLTDIKDKEKLAGENFGIEAVDSLGGVTVIFGRQPLEEEIDSVDLILLSPGVPPDIPPLRIARKKGIVIASEIEYANCYYRGTIIAVTGTNGKTTTTTLLAELLRGAGFPSAACGNIGDAFVLYANEDADFTAALEISSFQLDMTIRLHPKIAIITNITPDHLDRHGTMENYAAAKAKVFSNMEEGDSLIVNGDDLYTRELRAPNGCRTLLFTTGPKREGMNAWLDGANIVLNWAGKDVVLLDRRELKLLGIHNAANVMCAALAALLHGAPLESVRKTLLSAGPVEHRVEFVREAGGVKYVNDSKGTNPEATMTAINALDGERIVLILGGYDKHSDFSELFTLIGECVASCVVLGQTKEIILETAARAGYEAVTVVETFREAFDEATRQAKSMGGAYVLLSPACASWGMFADYEERGRIFKEFVDQL